MKMKRGYHTKKKKKKKKNLKQKQMHTMGVAQIRGGRVEARSFVLVHASAKSRLVTVCTFVEGRKGGGESEKEDEHKNERRE